MKNKLLKYSVCLAVALLFSMPFNIPTEASNPVSKYAIIVAGGASTKLTQTTNCGSSSSPYKGTYTYYNNGFSWTDYKFYVDLQLKDSDVSADYIGVMFRYQNSNNYYRLRLKNYYSTDYIYLEKFVNGNRYTLSSKSFTVDRNTWYTFKISLSGSGISVWQKTSPQLWQLVFSVSDSSISSGTIALYSCRCKGAWFDDVLIETSSMFKDLDFEREYNGQPANKVFPGYPTIIWVKVNDYGTGNWELSDSGESNTPFVEDQEDFYKECDDLYNKLVNKNYQIRYLSVDRWSDPDDDNKNEVYDIATSSSIEDAFDWMASMSDSNDKCLIYMFDHGAFNLLGQGYLFIDNNRDGDRQDISDKLYDYTVGNWIDQITSYDVMIFILEACYAGRFTYDIGYNSDDRIVITSTDASHWANPWWNNGQKTDWPVFSKHLFERLYQGYSFANAFNYAGDKVDDNNQYYTLAEEKQYPWLDDNGDGQGHYHDVPNGGDGSLAGSTYL